MIHIVCIKWGNKYAPEYVNNLYRGVCRNTTIPFSFTCYTDDTTGVIPEICQPLPETTWQGWWTKLLLFKPDMHKQASIGDRIVFLDLDIVITGNIDDILSLKETFVVPSDPYRMGTTNISSAFMSWEYGQYDYIYERFDGNTRPYSRGDQQFVEIQLKDKASRLQVLLPGQYVSFKADLKKGSLPENTRMVDFHGKPNPHECNIQWVKDNWK